ncbi:MAG: YbaN family protein [Steroidobacteraceae bacterium]|nr:YbaN family protein [Deltaproteobacteria bacterium]
MLHNNPGPANNHVKSDILRWILICCGWFCIVAGMVGIFLPLLPTVPFLLLAAACFARSSVRFHTWLIQHNRLGPLIRDYLNGGGMPLRAKRMAIGMVWVSVSASAFLFVQVGWLKIVLMAVAAGVTLYLLNLPTIESEGKGCESSEKRS